MPNFFSQNKLILILIAVIIAIILVIVFVFVPILFEDEKEAKKTVLETKSEPKSEPAESADLSQEELRNKRLEQVNKYETALEKKDFELCNEIDSAGTRDLCFEKIAVDLGDSSVCQNIENETDKNRCVFIVYKNKALEEKSADPCYEINIDNLIERCVSQVTQINFCQTEECIQALNQ